MLQSESRVETLEARAPIVHPKRQLRQGNWNVRTLYAQEGSPSGDSNKRLTYRSWV